MGTLDAQVHVGREAAYGTPVLTRSFEAKGDGHKRPPAFLESGGARAGMHALRSDRRRPVNMGAEGVLDVDIWNKGMGMLLRAAIGSAAIAQQGGSAAWLQTFLSTADGPLGESLGVQLGRPSVTTGTGVLPFTYHGGKVKSWEISQKVGDGEEGHAKLHLDLDYEDEDTTTLLAAPAYPASVFVFGWPELVVTVNGAPVDVKEFSVKGDNNLATDRRYARGNVLKKEPLRKGLPSYEGSMLVDFTNYVEYNRFVAGDILPIVATWTGAVISGAFNFLLRVTLQACQYDGETPDAPYTEIGRQALPFKVLHNGADPAVKIEYQSTDTGH